MITESKYILHLIHCEVEKAYCICERGSNQKLARNSKYSKFSGKCNSKQNDFNKGSRYTTADLVTSKYKYMGAAGETKVRPFHLYA